MDKGVALVAACAMYVATQSPYLTPSRIRRTNTNEKLNAKAISIHHVVGMLIAIAFVAALERHGWSEWGFNLHHANTSIRVALVFSVVYGGLSFLLHLTNPPQELFWEPTRRNTVAVLAFEWLLPGPSEEIIFRGLIQTFLSHTWSGTFGFAGLDVPIAGVIAALIFSAAHAYPKVDPAQLVTAFGLGIIYAVVLSNTGSLLGPVLIHNASDGLVTLAMLAGYRRQVAAQAV